MPSPPTIAALRFGFGLAPGHAPPADAGALLAALAAPDDLARRYPVLDLAGAESLHRALTAARRAARDGDPEAQAALKAMQAESRLAMERGAQMAVARAVADPAGLRERLMAFWLDHFTVRAKNQEMQPMLQVFADEAIRPHLTGRFAEMLIAAETHPMMLHYLDQSNSLGPGSKAGQKGKGGLNENLGRELLELHTLGVGAEYGQTDVRQMALLLTGLRWTEKTGWIFDPARAEPGAETVLGASYGGAGAARVEDIHAALADLAVHPATGRHLARKLAVHFVADDPDPALVDHVAAAYAGSGGALMPTYAALLDHPASWQGLGAKLRQPYDLLVAGLRAFGVSGDEVAGLEPKSAGRRLLGPLRDMGQPWMRAPGPDGWREEPEAWIHPQGLAARIQWAMGAALAWRKGDLPEPMAFAEAALSDALSDRLAWAVPKAETRPEAIGLVLAAPEFNRR
ncbi:DUF1800 domain-containing protein [Frigidibacter oleivorans]|uniref:DUF1800 domain-containing protein n=1 Tax=Frigidibacter oleivorans TaxID=2487129 RepID=UPI0013DF54BB|nr:DUF1800 domain-containing protein [Frigidibacter oleivorans]